MGLVEEDAWHNSPPRILFDPQSLTDKVAKRLRRPSDHLETPRKDGVRLRKASTQIRLEVAATCLESQQTSPPRGVSTNESLPSH